MEKLKKQNWFVTFLLAFITLGIYVPFWFKKVKKSLNNNSNWQLLNIFIVLAILDILFNFSFSSNMTANGVTTTNEFSTNYYHIGDILSWLYILVNVYFAFSVKNLLEEKYKISLNPIMTFFFSIIYLQHKINHITDVNQVANNISSTNESMDNNVN